MFERMVNYVVKEHNFPLKYNQSALPKLGMGPLWKEIMANIDPILNNEESDSPPPKLALFSGHDTTIMPILATLGEDVWSGFEWAPYASMMLIEVYEVADADVDESEYQSGFAFRLIYNGDVLTSKMDGCSSELCDIENLLDQVLPFAKYEDRDCASVSRVTPPTDEKSEDLMTEMKSATETLIQSPGGVGVVFGLVLISAALGSVLTCFCTRRRYRKAYHYSDSLKLNELSMSGVGDDNYRESTDSIESAVSAYGATQRELEEKDRYENSLI